MVLLAKLERLADGKAGLIRVVALFVLYVLLTAVLYVFVGPALKGPCKYGDTNREWRSLDSIQHFYTAEEAIETISACSDTGRQIYFWSEIFDTAVYSVVIALWSAMGILHAVCTFMGPHSAARWLVVIPLLYLIADWSENFSIMAMIVGYPQPNSALGTYLGIIGLIKWSLGFLGGALALFGVIASGIYLLTSKESYQKPK